MNNIKIYTSPTCHWCHKAKQWLNENELEFQEIDISNNQEKSKELIEKSGQMGVPVINVNNKIIVGFDVEAIKKAIQQ